ncbi:ecto-nucleotidase precursor [Bombyx mori]|uniref:5'-nucleotidase n=1 Tax=Bombyx mori TaxID=7091 RepID=Q1HPJ6_BOMMO|nr:ecto-nucleotidase precursor [Bombyx mori]ABF51495.1 ecto-nucleotidase [Bombyx mori]
MEFLTQLIATLAVMSLTGCSVARTNKDGTFELLILHNNDMHAKFEQTSQLSGVCTEADMNAGKCYGGFARVAYLVKQTRKAAQTGEGPPVLYLNAGDTYTGSPWFAQYKWKIAAEFINALQPDAVSLGNHEFDDGVEGVIPFIRNVTMPVLAANLILTKVPELKQEPNLRNTIIITINNIQMGIIGYLTPDTKFMAQHNDVEYEDEVVAIRREVKKLKEENVKIIIALGHSGLTKDLQIAKEVDDLDLVIGGHSNTFLSNEKTSEIPEVSKGPYPMIVKQRSGRLVRVVQAYAFTKYLGKLHIIFDNNGEIIRSDGNPVLLNQIVPEDPDVLKLVNQYRKVSEEKRLHDVVGTSMVQLDGEQCRVRECNIGNLIATAALNYTKEYHQREYPNVNIAVIQGGKIRGSIVQKEKPFVIRIDDWLTAFPFTDNLTILSMNGSTLRRALEHSVTNWTTIDSPRQFLQFDGMEVVYDLSKPNGHRVVKAKAICSNCGQYKPVDIKDYYEYEILIGQFLADGGDGFSIFSTLPRKDLPYNEIYCILNYTRKYSPLNPKLTGRIVLLNEETIENQLPSSVSRLLEHSLMIYFCVFILCIRQYVFTKILD